MDPNSDAPSETATGDNTGTGDNAGGATAYGMLFSHAEESVPAGPPPKAAKRTPTKRTPKKSAEQVDEQADETSPTAGEGDEAPVKPAARKTTAKKTTAKKATAKKTTAKKSATKKSVPAKSARSTSSSTGDVDPDSTETEQTAAQEDAATATADTTTGAQDPTSESNAPTDDAEETEEAAPQAASPFGLIFQAPDLSAVPARPARRGRTGSDEAGAERAGGSQRGAGRTGDAEGENAAHGAGDQETGEQDSTDQSGRGQRGRRSGRSGSGPDGGPARARQGEGSEDRVKDDARQGGPDASGEDASGEDDGDGQGRRRRRRGGKGRRGRGADAGDTSDESSPAERGPDDAGEPGTSGDDGDGDGTGGTVRRRRRSNRRGEDGEARESRRAREEVTGVRGSTRLEAKRQRRREGREAGRRRTIITEAEFLARRESVERTMVVRGLEDRTQIGVLEDGVLVEHYVSRETQTTMVGNVYLGRVQNVLPSMEAAFVDIGKGRNAVLYAGEVNWDAAGLDGNSPKRIENALKSGDSVLVQVTKDPIGHKGARLTSQVSLPGRYLVLVPGNSMTGISRKLPDTERTRLKKILKEVVPEGAGVIVRTAAEGASEAELRADVERLTGMWQRIEGKQKSANAPALLHGEPDMTVRVIRDVFNEDFAKVVVSGERAWSEVSDYIDGVAPDLADRLEKWTGTQDVFTHYRVTEALAKAMDRKVWLPSGGSLVIDRTEAMTVVDVNTGKFVGSGGNLEETVTKNNIEAAEEIVRQLRLRDIGGIIVIDFIDMVLEGNRDLVVRRLLECLGRDRTKHQVAEVTSLGLVQMTRKRVGAGLIEVFSEPCVHCSGRGIVVHAEPIEKSDGNGHDHGRSGSGGRRGRGRSGGSGGDTPTQTRPTPAPGGPTPAQIAAAAHAAAIAGAAQTASTDEVPDTSGTTPEAPAAESGATPDVAATTDVAATPGAPVTTEATETPDVAVTPDPAVTKPVQAVTGEDGAAEPSTPPVVAEPLPAARPRRRRGRVVAPAGPPGGATGSEPTAVAPSGPESR
ncbi:Rne/Rng family ribonuclease [Ornithinimicrobium sp. F0845]|uniref:Rne/Rng family ribonuclease n=1 Tax=Ornithinimicrobium sp. F0845 TaxID=2926412 RepID=UPI001FF60821|nr:Rne/Rng family ribonuclease [Ornithinimicrobium sp. F0845]MCK0111228.1 Rne/Rng family ribonuclease [Ornithinimicrobium sp. F0845]